MERYRSGHNEAVLKTVWLNGHVGSNPTLSANFFIGEHLARRFADLPKWWRGSPAKGVGRETGARVQISQSAPNSEISSKNSDILRGYFLFLLRWVLPSFEKFSPITVPVTVHCVYDIFILTYYNRESPYGLTARAFSIFHPAFAWLHYRSEVVWPGVLLLIHLQPLTLLLNLFLE